MVGTPEMENTILKKFPRFETLWCIVSGELLAENQAFFDNFKTSSQEQDYLQLLKDRPDLLRRVPQYQLASYLGIIPQSLSRLRKRIVKKEQTYS
jgi:hypothetical protein